MNAAHGTTTDLPIFSQRLDDLLGEMLKGEAPNVGRFCGYCYTPLRKKADSCPHCSNPVTAYAPVEKLPPDFIAIYKRMRKRESLMVNSFAFGGIFLAVMLFVGLVAISVYRFHAGYWALGVSTGVLFVTARVFAGLLGGWIGDDVAYKRARAKLAAEWAQFDRERAVLQGSPTPVRTADPHTTHVAPNVG